MTGTELVASGAELVKNTHAWVSSPEETQFNRGTASTHLKNYPGDSNLALLTIRDEETEIQERWVAKAT